MNQGKLDVVKQEMAKLNINILGTSELKWMGIGKLNFNNLYIYSYESIRRNGVVLIFNTTVQITILGYNLKSDRTFTVCFQGKSFFITII